MRRWIGSLVALWALLLPLEVHAEGRWLRGETPRFIVYGEDGQDKLLSAVRDLEALDGLLRRMSATTAPPSPVRLEVYLFDAPNRLRLVWPGISPDIAGFYVAKPDLIAAFNDYSEAATDDDIDGRQVLYHEYAHHFMLHYFANAYPTWYVEGFAEYIATARFRPGRIEVGRVPQIRANWLGTGNLLPIEQILRGLDEGASSEDTARFYAQSWLAVHYLINTPARMTGFRAYVVALRGGGDPVTSFQPAFGITVREFDAELRRYKAGRLNAYALTKPADTAADAITVTRLPVSADTLLLLDARARMGRDGDAAVLSAVRTAVAAYPDDGFAQRTLARAEIGAGAPQDALPVLDAVLARTPEDAAALYLKGLALLEMSSQQGADAIALRRQARPLLGRANRLAPDNPHTLFRYAYAADADPHAGDEGALNVLLLAQQLAPQVGYYRLNAAHALMWRDRYDEAAFMLRPLVFDPHDAGMAKLAKRMMDAAVGHRQMESVAEVEEVQ